MDGSRLPPPHGDGTEWGKDKLKAILFSPPYGDCTVDEIEVFRNGMFSPPYGDCTKKRVAVSVVGQFSPPYGDCILNISQNTEKLKSRMAREYSLYCNDVLLR